ncbi:MAG TPA: hypothetical protein VGR37_01725 [Longimicrobiaceae bacterium]|nr:hypothetical protein [Longimicrobiaceae bacterium]
MRTFHLVALCLGASLLAACADKAPTTRSTIEPPSPGVPETALRSLQSGSALELQQAVAALADAPDVTEAGVERVAQVSREADDLPNRIAAIEVLQRWLTRQPGLRVEVARALLRTAQGPHEDMVRGMAVQVIALHPRGDWPQDVVASLGRLVQTDPLAQNREIAALALGHVRGAQAGPALESLRAAYATEMDRSSRRAMLLNIVEVAGRDAPRVLAGLNESSPLIVQDIRDYQEILGRGATRIAEIWDQKLARDIERGTVIGTEKEKAHLAD